MSKSKLYKVCRSPIHGTGVFATAAIKRNERIIEYTGDKVTKAESDHRSLTRQKVFFFILNKRYDIDGSVRSNVARFINHSCDPNCYTEVERGRVWIYSDRLIQPGEELSYDYGYALADDWKDYPCYCKSSNCQNYIIGRRAWSYLKKRRLAATAA